MAFSKTIYEKIKALSRDGEWTRLLRLLEDQLQRNRINVQDILDWVLQPREPIPSAMINRIGVMIGELESPKQRNFAPQFYKLAAELKNSDGCANYAQCFLWGKYHLEKSPQKALIYTKKAVEWGNENPYHKLLLYSCLKENGQNEEAIDVLMQFLRDLAANKKSIDPRDQDEAIKLCDEMIEEFISHFDSEHDPGLLIEKTCRHYLSILDSFLSITELPYQFRTIHQKAYFLKGRLHEYLKDAPLTMVNYCKVKKEDPEIYEKSILGRARLLKRQARILLVLDNDIENGDTKMEKSDGESEMTHAPDELMEEIEGSNGGFESADDKSEWLDCQSSNGAVQDGYLILPHNVRLPANFRKFWTKEATWFYSVNEEALNDAFELKKAQIEQLFNSRRLELSLALEWLEELNGLISEKDAIKEKIDTLNSEKNELIDALSHRARPYFVGNRCKIRMYETEKRFFDFNRSKKKKYILDLVSHLIDHRVRTSESEPEPIRLSGVSSRLLITAEKLFQTAIMSLGDFSSSERTVNLPLPVGRSKPWRFERGGGTTCYAPCECYLVGETEVISEYRTEPRAQRLGDSYISDISHYDDICQFLYSDMTGEGDSKKTKKVAEWMIRYGREGAPLVLKELQAICSNLEEWVLNRNVHQFNKICFLISAKEQVQWLSATDAQYQLGMIVAQARCFIMLEAGFISLKEAFATGALFGVYTAKNLIKDSRSLARPCEAINALYLTYLQSKNNADYMRFFKKVLVECDKEKSTQKSRTLVLTRKQAHEDLKYVYGGDSDTDGEGYESDLEMDVSSSNRPGIH